ncbi:MULTISPECIES: alpha/beta fold hydrolase [unclassified Paracoccus (in: a-proteobacteria)]|uniref:alpha/beta fold hydrolase n=1 Tax=unclassified Paracoccus (in: a-proteobacteria) TaxID=2688777 RepID=UPI001600CD20|nr:MULTISPECIES: alpha/beta fold hydrolase [unclassified Paracoccus (in: a-proteobacteria)]MBB1492883.1 alpha/beta fold hydrolase [Paracoccus sp. MC1854]MBB1499418.1 alpha/beta fold hydrolase [Paracoccus sp. MC1862]QQO45375.1 alpha/beta fold hydrolase [Paracoccus sp. MC1862]
MELSLTLTGQPGPQPPVLVVHGLFGQARNLGVISRALSETRQVIAVDMRNHGESPWDDRHDYDAMAEDLAGVIRAHGGLADVVGHSMGGKAAMRLATTHAGLVQRLVALDIAPVAYAHTQNGVIDAIEATDFSEATSRSQADAALAQNLRDPGTRAFLLQSLDVRATPPRWKMNLSALRANMDKLTGWPEGGQPFDGPALFLHGGDSDYVDDGGKAAIRSLFPQAVIEAVPGTGHWLHADKPAEVAGRVATFLN